MLPDIQAEADRMDKLRQHAAPAQSSDRCGSFLVSVHDSDKVVACDLVQCAHCGYFWQFVPGSGKRRGRCGKCSGLVCGHAYCNTLACTHAEQRLENMESGRSFDFHPILVSVPDVVPA